MANQIIVSEDRNQITVVEGETRIVEVVTQGPQGPIGPVGPQGPSGSSILNQITSGSVTASVDIGSNVFRISSGAQPYLGLTYENGGIMRHQNSSPPYFTIFNNNGGVNMTPGAIGFIEIGGQRGGGGGTMVRFSGTYIGDGNSRNARLSIGTAQGTGFGTNQISIFKLSSGSFTNQPITIIGTSVDSYSTSSIDITGSYASRATTIINGGTGNSIVSFDYNGVPQTVLFPNGNWGINTFADGGQKLQVTGTTRLAGDATITGSLTVTGNITAQTLVVQTITSSVSFITGSTKFGSLLTNTHQFTGSIFLSGSMGIGTSTPATLFDIYSAANANSSLQVGESQNVRVSINTQSGNRFGLLTISRIGDGATPAVSIGVGTGPTSTSGVISTNNDSLIFGYNIGNAFTETFRINTSNRLLLGLTTDDTVNRLQVSGSTRLIGGLVVTGSTTITSGLSVGSDTTINGIARINTASTYALRLLNSTIIAGHDGSGGSELSLNLSTAYLSGYGALQLRTLQSGNLTLATSNTNRVWVSGVSGNVSIGSSNDSGDRLQVYGATFLSGSVTGSDMLIRGSGNTSALEVQNNSGGLIAQFRNDTRLTLGGKVDIGLTNILFNNYSNTLNILGIVPAASWASDGTGIWFFDRTASSTSGTLRQIRLGGIGSGFTPTSGTATHTHLEINSTISQSSATGITRGLYVNPTLTSAADWRSIEWSNNSGWGLYGSGSAPNYLNGSLSIGETGSISAQKLQVYGDTLLRGSGTTSGTFALRIKNSADSDLFFIRNNGLVYTGDVEFISSNGVLKSVGNLSLAVGTAGGLSITKPANLTATSGDFYWLWINPSNATSFVPASGNATMTFLSINPAISQSSATGITRGLYVVPSLTSAADWRSIEWTNNTGWGLYGAGSAPNFLSGSLGIGTAPSESLSVSQLRAVVSIKDNTTSTNSTTFFGAYDDFLQLSANRNPSTGIFSNTGKATSQISLQGSTNSGSIYFYTTNTNNTIPIERARITGIGNLLLGTTTDDGVNKLQVSGSTLLKGSGNTSGTNALVVQNSDAVSIMSFRNDGNIYADGTNFTITKYTPGATTLTVSNTGHNDAVGIRTTSAVGLQAVSSLGVSANNTRGASIYAAGGAQTGNISLGLLSNRALITSVASGMAMHTSSMLQVDSTSQGFLPPRMTTAQKNAITTPAAGLVVYDTTLNKLCVYTTTWETITSA